jgi:hypothetical protein
MTMVEKVINKKSTLKVLFLTRFISFPLYKGQRLFLQRIRYKTSPYETGIAIYAKLEPK